MFTNVRREREKEKENNTCVQKKLLNTTHTDTINGLQCLRKREKKTREKVKIPAYKRELNTVRCSDNISSGL